MTALLGTCVFAGPVAAHAQRAGSTVAQVATATSAPSVTLVPVTSKPRITPRIQEMLNAMERASTWGHPDLFGEFNGMERFYAGHYKSALKYFKYGARYADKVSQFVIGLMYFNGRGVKRNPATACAWLTLAAQRKYPHFVQVRKQVCQTLSPAETLATADVLARLMPVYGDKVAKRRMKLRLLVFSRYYRTGTYVSDNPDPVYMSNPRGKESQCTQPDVVVLGMHLPKDGCIDGNIWSPWRWDPKKYFARRDAQWTGRVVVGPLNQVPAPATSVEAESLRGATH